MSRSDATKDAYETLIAHVKRLGPIQIQEKKTSIHLAAGNAAFLGVHPRKDGIRINIVLARKLENRVVKAEQVSKCRFHNEIDHKGSIPIDPELASWIEEAYRLQKG